MFFAPLTPTLSPPFSVPLIVSPSLTHHVMDALFLPLSLSSHFPPIISHPLSSQPLPISLLLMLLSHSFTVTERTSKDDQGHSLQDSHFHSLTSTLMLLSHTHPLSQSAPQRVIKGTIFVSERFVGWQERTLLALAAAYQPATKVNLCVLIPL